MQFYNFNLNIYTAGNMCHILLNHKKNFNSKYFVENITVCNSAQDQTIYKCLVFHKNSFNFCKSKNKSACVRYEFELNFFGNFDISLFFTFFFVTFEIKKM